MLQPAVDKRIRLFGQGVFDDITGWQTRPFDINWLLWGLIGGAALGLVMFLLSAPRRRLARLPLAVIGFTGFGLLTAFALDESARPALDWSTLSICVGVGVVVFGLIGLWRATAAARRRCRSSPARVGWLVGAWGGADIGAGNFRGVVVRHRRSGGDHRRPLRAAAPPDARSAGASSSARGPWIFVTPALRVHRRRAARSR